LGGRHFRNFTSPQNKTQQTPKLKILDNFLFKSRKPAKYGFFGDYSSWEDAQSETGGYDQPGILAKTEIAMRQILAGRAAFERDSVLLPNPEYPWPLISCLLYVAQADGNRLSVLDFGGALGSTYYQCRPFLKNVSQLAWMVVEQKHYVESGRREFSRGPVSFHEDVQGACLLQKPNFLLLSSVLPYLPDPWSHLDELLALDIRCLVIDRVPFLGSNRDRLTVQKVPPEIYPASYPAWFFSRNRLLSICARHQYRERAEWTCADDWNPDGGKASFVGLFLEKTE
jgi:putative methyltransferase (TIGR04325 family)